MTVIETSPLSVRTISLADADAIAELSGQLGYQTSLAEMVERLRGILPLPDGHLALVACRGDEVIGWIEAELTRHLQSVPHVLITGLVVKDGSRSLGVGKRLCKEVEQWAIAQGVSVVRVTSRSTREDAHRFYLREDFTQTKTSLVFEKVLSRNPAAQPS
jgi:predicted N-acetyltransferase YhbS